MEEKEKNIFSYVKERLVYLHALKKPRFDKYWKFRNEYSQDNIETTTEDWYTNYHLNVGFALVENKTAEVYASTPKYDFVGIDENGRQYKRLVEKFWEWIWKKSNTNKAVGNIIRDAFKYWTWFWRESFVTIKRTVNVPYTNDDWTTSYIEKEIVDYKWCKLTPLEWHNVYLNGSSLDNCTEACIITHWDKDEWQAAIGDAYWVSANDILKGKQYYVGEGNSELTIRDTSRSSNTQIDWENTISQIEYFNKYKDEYYIIAGETHVNVDDCYLPDPHKEIPIVAYVDYEVDNDIYGRGEFDITENTRKLMDEVRSTAIETVKMQGGIITIDPSSDFDETVTRIGLKQFAHVAKGDLEHFVPNVNIAWLELISKNLAEDIIVESWVDYRGQIFWPNETAERTKWRIEAQRKRVNKNIRDNAYSFYERLARLRMENIKTQYKWESLTIPVQGSDIDEGGVASPLGSSDYGIMKVTDKMLRGEILLIPVIDSIYWDSSKEQKQKWLEVFQILINLVDKDWKKLIDPALLIDSWKGIIDDVIDLDKVLGWNSIIDREVNMALKERGIDDRGVLEMESWGWVPPAQQSGAPLLLPSSPNYSPQA